jgi:integrase
MSQHALETWRLSLIADGYARRTVEARVGLVELTARRAGVAPEDLRRTDVVDQLGSRDYATWSRRTYLQHLTAWAEWIGRPDLTAGIRRPPPPAGLPDPLPEQDLRRLMRHLAGCPPQYAWVVLGAFAGLRAGEVARFHRDHIHGDVLRLQGKGGRTDVVPIPPVLREALRPWADVDGLLWPLSPSRVSNIIRRRAAEIGVRMRFHQLRHRFGTAVYRQTHDLLLTQRLMRHASPQTTAGYAALVDDDARQAVDQIPGATPGTEPPP